MRAYEGYFEEGRFNSKGQSIRSEGRQRAVLTIIDDTISVTEERLNEFDRINDLIRVENASDKSKKRSIKIEVNPSYALSVDILTYFINGNKKISDSIREIIAKGHALIIPPTVFFEIRREFIKNPSPAKEGTFDCICALFKIGEMNVPAWEQAAKIYANSRTAGYPVTDIITAAYCAANGHKLISTKPSRFLDIEGLSVISWKY